MVSRKKKSNYQLNNESIHGKLPPEFDLHYSAENNKDFYSNNLERVTTWTDPRTLDEYNIDLINEEFDAERNSDNE